MRDRIAAGDINQNLDKDFSISLKRYPDKIRYCSKSLFSRNLTNGEVVNRSWLVFSPSTGRVFCVVCKIFSGTTQFATSGFNDWRNSKRIEEHEGSLEHRKYTNDLIRRSRLSGRIDSELIKALHEETVYWKNVLLRVVETIKSLCSRGLPLRGHTDTFGSSSNGNFLATLELIAKFDPFLADHIARFGNAGRGIPSYLSHTIVDELIIQIGGQLEKKIIIELQKAKYYSIIVDSTPDISHVDQLTFVLRYVLSDSGIPIERFICFIPNVGHKSQQLADVILEKLEVLGINIMDCRGQSYDNAANMSGQYTGLQARLKDINPLATYVPCAAHSLNLVGTSAVGFCEFSTTFFGIEQELYNFFSVSTYRWSQLQTKFSLKSLSVTRWSARADASKALYTSYSEIVEVLQLIAGDVNEKPTTRSEAKALMIKLNQIEIAILTCFWHKVLERFKLTSKKLQAVDVDLDTVIGLYNSLLGYLSSIRKEFDAFESEGLNFCKDNTYQYDARRKRKRKLQFDEGKEETKFRDGKDQFRIAVFLPLVDKLMTELSKRRESYLESNKNFGFLAKLTTLSDEDLRERCSNLVGIYKNDLEDGLVDEIFQLRSLPDLMSDTFSLPTNLLKKLKTSKMNEIFPNVEIALRIFACKAVTNCSGERSFSALKRVKNYLRSNLSHSKLSNLAIMAIESNLLNELDFMEIIEIFAANKSRKKT